MRLCGQSRSLLVPGQGVDQLWDELQSGAAHQKKWAETEVSLSVSPVGERMTVDHFHPAD